MNLQKKALWSPMDWGFFVMVFDRLQASIAPLIAAVTILMAGCSTAASKAANPASFPALMMRCLSVGLFSIASIAFIAIKVGFFVVSVAEI